MKEHPDYKYRPRRKPKTLVNSKKESKYGFNISPLLSNGGNHHLEHPLHHQMPRNLMPQLLPPNSQHSTLQNSSPHIQTSTPHHSILNESDVKFPRTLFPTFPYSLYHPLKMPHPDQVMQDSTAKMANDLAFLYNSSIYSQTMAAAAAGWPGSLSHPCMVACGCPPPPAPLLSSPSHQPIKEHRRSPSPVISESSDSPDIKRPVAYVLMKPNSPEDYRRDSPVGSERGIPQHVI